MNLTTAFGDLAINGQGLDDKQVRDILARRVRTAAEQAAQREPGLAVIVCMIGGERFAVPLAAIAEVLPAVKPTRVPGAPDSLAGLIVRRGLVYNLIDPAPSLGVMSGESGHMLLLRGPVPRLALKVDEATGTSELSAAEVDGGGLTDTRFGADGARVELIAVARLVATLGIQGRIELT